MEILFFMVNLLVSSPADSNVKQVNRQDARKSKEGNAGNTIVDDLNGLIR